MRLADLLVDLAAVAGASRAVASKHVALRARQVERYGRGSSVVGAVLRGRPPAEQQSPGEHAEETATATAGEGGRQPQQQQQDQREGVRGGEGVDGRGSEEGPVAGEVREAGAPVPEPGGRNR